MHIREYTVHNRLYDIVAHSLRQKPNNVVYRLSKVEFRLMHTHSLILFEDTFLQRLITMTITGTVTGLDIMRIAISTPPTIIATVSLGIQVLSVVDSV